MNEELYQELHNFVEEIWREYPDAIVDVRDLMINNYAIADINYKEKDFVLEAVPGEGYGITRMTPYNGFLLGSDVCFQTLREAKEYLIQQMV